LEQLANSNWQNSQRPLGGFCLANCWLLFANCFVLIHFWRDGETWLQAELLTETSAAPGCTSFPKVHALDTTKQLQESSKEV